MAWEPSTYKKDVRGEMPNAYDPKKVEQCWGEFWEKEGLMGADAAVSANIAAAAAPRCASAAPADPAAPGNAQTVLSDTSNTEKFVMVIPPPSVTGSLHLGHALTTAIEDCLTRW